MSKFSTELMKVSEPRPHVALVEFARKPINAFSRQLWEEYSQVLDQITASGDDIRAIVVASALPKIFAGGIDLNAFSVLDTHDKDPARAAFLLKGLIKDMQDSVQVPERCAVPVIAAVHGGVIGMGVDIITACDIRIAASNTTFSIREADIGQAADLGTLSHLMKVTGNASLARELAYTARNFTAAEAAQLGLLSKVVEGGRDEVVSAALVLAEEIATKSPVAVAGTKALLNHARDHSVAENLSYTQLWNGAMVHTEDIQKNVASVLSKSKKTPEFRSLSGKAKL